MEEKEKLVKLSENAWHYKLLKWTWDIDPKMFKNLCPYFWLCVAGVFFIPVTLVKKLFVHIKLMLKIRNKQKQEHREEILKTERENLELSEEEVYQIFKYYRSGFYYSYTSSRVSDLICKHGRSIYEDLANNGKFDSFSEKTIKDYEKKLSKYIEESRAIKKKEEAKKEQQKERLRKISFGTSVAATFLMCLCIVGLISLAANLLCVILIAITQNLVGFSIGLTQFLLILLSVIVCTVGFISANNKYLIHKGEEYCDGLENRYFKILGNIFYIPYYPLRLFWDKVIVLSYKIIVSIFVGFIEGIGEFGGLFSSYLSSSYSDYCPGIEWEENNNDNDKK